ncbi:MAG: hypothetical protein BMS9Abin03_248 [Thermodesulfobacteriota bacterium]|nr:MAG: hypothetical protein BMS9Abin03_248 [Thermodesulfobacteriota bacterium]
MIVNKMGKYIICFMSQIWGILDFRSFRVKSKLSVSSFKKYAEFVAEFV